MEILRDPVWQSVGVLLALFVPLCIYLLQRQRKAVRFEVVTDIPLLTVREKSLGGLQVTFNGAPMQAAGVIVVRFINAGNTPVVRADYESPISMEFPPSLSVLAAEVISSKPQQLAVEATIVGSTVNFSEVLLNSRDSFTCRVLVDGDPGPLKIGGRIAGVKEIDETKDSGIDGAVGTIALLVSGIAFYLSPSPMSFSFSEFRMEELPYALVIGLSATVALIASSRTWLRTVTPQFRSNASALGKIQK